MVIDVEDVLIQSSRQMALKKREVYPVVENQS